jgi:hypothetical protein
MKKNKNYAVFILSHGRANNVITVNTLREQGYTGRIYIICDDLDEQIPLYQQNYGKENVLIFNKLYAMSITDTADNFNDKRAVVYARNMCHSIAKELGLEYFLELDDDYTMFDVRYDNNGKMGYKRIKNLDNLFYKIFDYLDSSGAKAIAMAQGGDYIGGVNSSMKDGLKRKVMNSFFCRTDRPFQFYGKINEDYTAYTLLGSRGDLFLTLMELSLEQLQTQSNSGGLTDIYLNLGTYVKSFYSVIFMPSAVKVSVMGNRFMRIHHKTKWNNCVPKIINEKYKKV